MVVFFTLQTIEKQNALLVCNYLEAVM